jgi:hypothetical protein
MDIESEKKEITRTERAFRGALSFLDERRARQDLQVPRLIEKKPCQGGKIGRNGASDWHDGKYKV